MKPLSLSRLSMAVLATLLTLEPAAAETKTSSFDARVDVSATCSLGASDLRFPAVTTGNLTNVDASTSLSVTCSSGTPYQISMSEGANFNSTRRLAWGSSFISYGVFSDSSRSQSWMGATVVAGTGSGAAQQIPVYGRIFSGQSVPTTGSYADTIVATISY